MNYKDKIVELRGQGFSRDEIREKLSCSLFTVSKYLSGPVSELGVRIMELRGGGASVKEIQDLVGCSRSTVSKWCGKVLDHEEIRRKNLAKRILHPLSLRKQVVRNEHKDRQGPSSVYRWKQVLYRRRRQFLLDLFGGRCCVCGYDFDKSNLQFHHMNDREKLFGLSTSKLIYHSMEAILMEANKCILLCANHHGEVTHGLLDVIKWFKPFDVKSVVVPDDVRRYSHQDLDADAIVRERNWVAYKLKLRNRVLRERSEDVVDLDLVVIRDVKTEVLKGFLHEFHYLGLSNKGLIRSFGFFVGDRLVGVAQVTNPVRQLSQGDDVCEVSRFCLSNGTPNLASKCLGLVLRALVGSKYKYVQAFADESVHTGVIYRAVGFSEAYRAKESYNYSGIHKKTIYERACLYNLSEHKYAEIFGLVKVLEGRKIKFVRKIGM